MKNKVLNFELNTKDLKIKELLKGDFLQLEMYAISDANPNVNNSHFQLEAMQNALSTFINKPILGSFNPRKGVMGDFRAHNDNGLHWDPEMDEMYFDYNSEDSERILGVIRESDKVEIEKDEKTGLNWVKFSCCLWCSYAYKAIKSLLKARKGKSSVSVEVEVLDSYEDENGVEQITKFNFLGCTILGQDVTPGITGANLSVVDFMNDESYAKKQKCLSFAYSALDDYNHTKVETPKEENNINSKDSNKNFESETPIENEEEPQVNMEGNEEKVNQEEGGKPAMQLTMQAKMELLRAALEKAIMEKNSSNTEGEEPVCCYTWVMDIDENYVYFEVCDEKFRCPYSITANEDQHDVTLNLDAQEKVVPSWSVFSTDEEHKETEACETCENKEEEACGNKEEEATPKADGDEDDAEVEKSPSPDKKTPKGEDEPKKGEKEDEACDNKQDEACETCEAEACQTCEACDEPKEEEACTSCEADLEAQPKEEEACETCEATEAPEDSKEEEACTTCAADDSEDEPKDETPKEAEVCDDKQEEACDDKQEEACQTCEAQPEEDSENPEDDSEDTKETEAKEENVNPEDKADFADTEHPNNEPTPVDTRTQPMSEIVATTVESITAPEVQTEVDKVGDANAEAKIMINNLETAEINPTQLPEEAKSFEPAPPNEVEQPDDNAKALDFEHKEEQSESAETKPVEAQENFDSKVEANNEPTEEPSEERSEFSELLKKYNELEEKFNKLNEAAKHQEADRLFKFGQDFINADEVVDEENKQNFIAQVSEKCYAYELNSEEEVTKFAKSLMAMYYYEHQRAKKENNNRNENNFSVTLNKNVHTDNKASNNKLKDAINKLNYLNKEE